jgi:hypothetical protein
LRGYEFWRCEAINESGPILSSATKSPSAKLKYKHIQGFYFVYEIFGKFFMFADTKLEKRGEKEKRRRKGRHIGGNTSQPESWQKMDNTLIAIIV